MTGQWRWLAPAAALLVLFPPVHAEAPHLTAQAVEASGALAGPVVGLVWLAEALPRFTVQASAMAGTVEHSERALVVAGAALLPANEGSTPIQASAVHLRGISVDGDARILVLARPEEATAALAGPVHVAPAARGDGAPSYVPRASSTRAPLEFPAVPALDVRAEAAQEVHVRGSVLFVISGVDLQLDTEDGPMDVRTRREVEPVGPGAQRVVSKEAFLEMSDVDLALPAGFLLLGSAVLEGGDWILSGASGSLRVAGPDIALDNQDVQLRGPDGLALEPSGEAALDVDFFGAVVGVTVDGQAVAMPTSPSPTLAWGSGALAAILVAAALHIAQGRRRFARMDGAMDRRDYGTALALARRFGLHPRLAQDAALAQAICLLALGEPAAALAGLDSRGHWAVHQRPTRDFLAARAEAALGRAEAAGRRLGASLAANPALLSEAHADPVLAPLLGSRRRGPEEAYA